MTLQYVGGSNRETMLNAKWMEGTGLDIPAVSDASPDAALIPNMSVKKCIEEVRYKFPSQELNVVVRLKIDFRFTDVFDRDWFGEAYFAGIVQEKPISSAESDAEREPHTVAITVVPSLKSTATVP